jgi:curved DNA-binding protein CbpA
VGDKSGNAMKSGIKHNHLYLIWKDPRSRRKYIVGKLSRGDKYTFEYCEEYKLAKEVGWDLLVAFPEEKQYESQTLFAAFSSRLPDPKRRDIVDILKKYNLEEYDGYELLKKSTGRLPIDTYEFIDPIFSEDEKNEARRGTDYNGPLCQDIFTGNYRELLLFTADSLACY